MDTLSFKYLFGLLLCTYWANVAESAVVHWHPNKPNEILVPHLKILETMDQFHFYRGKRGGSSDNESLPKSEVKILKGPPKQITIKENESTQMTCGYEIPNKYYEQNLALQLRWRKDGKIIRQMALSETEEANNGGIREDGRLVINKENGSLIWAQVAAMDAGQYQCEILVEGFKPTKSISGEMKVIEMLKFSPQPTSKNVELGSVGKVHCKAQGTPTPKIKWMKDLGEELPTSVQDVNGTLTFRNATNDLGGTYTCYASNSQGEIKATVTINVVVAPKFLVAPEEQMEILEGAVALFHCQAIGDPIPTIQWDKDSEYLNVNNTDGGRFRLMDNGTLEIQNVHIDDGGSYGCTIGSSAGLKRQEVLLIVQPSSPSDLEKSPQGSLISKVILIIMSLAFAYFMLVVGLKIWYRYRRNNDKLTANEANKKEDNSDAVQNNENEPCLPSGSTNKNEISLDIKKSNNSGPSPANSEAKINDANV